MENEKDDDLIMYEESKEIKETIWKVWDLLNDKEIVTKLILNSNLVNILNKAQSHTLLNLKENKILNKEKSNNNGNITINIEDIQYQYHLKIIIYKIESPILLNKLNQDKSNISEHKSSENSYSGNKNITESNIENNSNDKHNQIKNCIKLNLTLQPNTLEGSKLLTINMTDYSEILNEEQLKDITQSIFKNFEEILINTVPLTKNCESIIIDANINIVFDFWASWKIKDIGDGIVKDVKLNGDPTKIGTKINYIYFEKYILTAIVEEVNSFIQEGNEDDNNEWNYKYKVIFQNGQSETLNCVFVSCENGTKTWISAENDINDKIGIEKLQELSERKLTILNSMKNYIEKNRQTLVDLYKKSTNKK